MYQVGDQVVYGIHGVCTVTDQEKQVVDRKTVTYLVLEPVTQVGARYLVPTHNEVAMKKLHPVLTSEQMQALIHSAEVRSDGWNRDENARKQSYRELISSGDRVLLMRMVHTLYRHKKEQALAGKKVHLSDENFLRDAEKLLSSEISVVMSLTYEQARAYLRKELNAE
jgi:CarD family transcriptional regulator